MRFDVERIVRKKEPLKISGAKKVDIIKQSVYRKEDEFLGCKTKTITSEQKLDLAEQWLEDTFPHLFAADDYLPLDHLFLQDLENTHNNNRFMEGYLEVWAIKVSIFRYKYSYGYLSCLRKGTPRYNLKGEVCGIVTKEEEKTAQKTLSML